MVGKTKTPTVAQKLRMERIKHDVGCIACRIEGRGYVAPDIHHLTDYGRRRGHRFTIGLCPAHHRHEHADPAYGPNLARDKWEFEQKYGTDDELLEQTDDWLEFFFRNTIGGAA